MRLKLFLLLSLLVGFSALADTGLRGVVIDSKTGAPVPGATVILDNQGLTATAGADGSFYLEGAKAGKDKLIVLGFGFKDHVQDVQITGNNVDDLGSVRVDPSVAASVGQAMADENMEMQLSESQLEDEEGNEQAVATLTGATDNPFYQAASYNWSIMRFRLRGYNNEYNQTYINGVYFNDAARGRFNYSMIGGMNQAFRNKSIGQGLDATSYAFGAVGGATNILTYAADYAPGLRLSGAYTNGNYRWRGMVTYSTGLMPNGWAMTVSGVARYAGEGVIPGSFYNSYGYFVALEKVFNQQHRLAITTFGAPTKRASNSATFEEAYKLAGDNLYNANWGWQEGEKRNARVVEAYDPTVILNWIWKPDMATSLNTGLAFHKSFYSSSALNWYNAPDPRPDYYRYLPSYWASTDPSVSNLYADLWQNDESWRQLDWQRLYQTNYMNNYMAQQTGTEHGSTYMIEKRHSNAASFQLNSTLDKRLTDRLVLQAGYGANYTRSSYYKTVKDLLGGLYWTDQDQYSERDFPDRRSMSLNDMDDVEHIRKSKGDRFGYDYDINQFSTNLWAQNVWNLPKWDLSYSAEASYTSYQRDGHMRNGRAPENSKGKGDMHRFFNWGVKGSASFKIDGRNNIIAHAYYGTRAPLSYNAYVSPRIKDNTITDLRSERIASGDVSYQWNYRIFKGIVTGFYTDMQKGTERTAFYDDLHRTFMNYALTNVHKVFKGVEIGMAVKMTPAVTLSAAANIARYQYKNRPTGTRSYENGSEADVTQTVYLKNFYVGSTPQETYSLALNYAAPHMWFFEVNGCWMNRSYVDLSPVRHEEMPDLYTQVNSEPELAERIKTITTQEKLNEALVINMSIGKVIYLSRSSSLNINLNLSNILDNKNIQTGGYQQGRFDYTNYNTSRYPNKYYYAQGFKMFLNVGLRF